MNPVRSLSSGNWPVRQATTNSRPSDPNSTSHSVYGNGLKPYARQGFNKDGDGLDIYKIITFYSLDSGLPVSFELQPGNIPDVISLVNAVPRAKAYGLKNPEFCLDNGFFSKENVLRFLRKNFKLIDPRHAQARLDLQALGQRRR